MQALVGQRLCLECATSTRLFEHVKATLAYSGHAQALINGLKTSGRLSRARVLAELMDRRRQEQSADGFLDDVAVLIPIPSKPSRLRERGFNPAGELARCLAKLVRVPVLLHGLRRNSHPPAQSSVVTRKARQRNATQRSFDVFLRWRLSAKGHID